MRPCIGITCGVNEQGRYSLPRTYVEALQQEGGRVILLPPGEAIWPEVDGLLLPGATIFSLIGGERIFCQALTLGSRKGMFMRSFSFEKHGNAMFPYSESAVVCRLRT